MTPRIAVVLLLSGFLIATALCGGLMSLIEGLAGHSVWAILWLLYAVAAVVGAVAMIVGSGEGRR